MTSKAKMGPCERSIRDYFGGVRDGTITACAFVRKVAARILDHLDEEPGTTPWHFSEKHAQKHIGFIEKFCYLPSGKRAKFHLELFQRAILSVVFGFVDDEGLRQYQEVFWVMGRKNGKTSLLAAILLTLLLNDGELHPAIYTLATSRDQAKQCFDDAGRMIAMNKDLSAHVRKKADGAYHVDAALGLGELRALASNWNSLDGLDISGGCIDELAAHKTRALYDLVMSALSARRQPLIFEITTNNFIRGSIFDSQVEYSRKWVEGQVDPTKGDRFLALIYELDDRDEWQEPKAWIKANPGLGTIKSETALAAAVSKAKDDKTELPNVLTKEFNLVANQAHSWLTYEEIHSGKTFDPHDDDFIYGVLGVDAADTTDLCAATVMLKRANSSDPHLYCLHQAWIPEDVVRAEEKSNRGRDGIPFGPWISRGLLRTVQTPIVDKRIILEWLDELREEYGIWVIRGGYDPYHMSDAGISEAFAQYLGATNWEKVSQRPKDITPWMRELQVGVYRRGLLVDNNHPVAEWCRSNLDVRVFDDGNMKPLKRDNDSRNRIDVWASEMDAYTTLRRHEDEYNANIGWIKPEEVSDAASNA